MVFGFADGPGVVEVDVEQPRLGRQSPSIALDGASSGSVMVAEVSEAAELSFGSSSPPISTSSRRRSRSRSRGAPSCPRRRARAKEPAPCRATGRAAELGLGLLRSLDGLGRGGLLEDVEARRTGRVRARARGQERRCAGQRGYRAGSARMAAFRRGWRPETSVLVLFAEAPAQPVRHAGRACEFVERSQDSISSVLRPLAFKREVLVSRAHGRRALKFTHRRADPRPRTRYWFLRPAVSRRPRHAPLCPTRSVYVATSGSKRRRRNYSAESETSQNKLIVRGRRGRRERKKAGTRPAGRHRPRRCRHPGIILAGLLRGSYVMSHDKTCDAGRHQRVSQLRCSRSRRARGGLKTSSLAAAAGS